jgi:hypothetical protein
MEQATLDFIRDGHGGQEGCASPRIQHRFDRCAASSFLAACRRWVDAVEKVVVHR